MGSNPPANTPPPKPWERAGSSSGPVPFKPPSAGNTSAVVEASGTARPGEVVTTANRNPAANTNTLGRPLPSRPWEQQNYGNSNTYGGYGSNLGYNSGYGSGMYGGGYGSGGYGGTSYGGGGLYGNNMYRGGYGGGMVGGSGMYGGGMYNGGIGGQMGGGYGMGMGMGGPMGNQDPNNPYGGPPASPPGFWMSFLRVMHGVVNVFGRISVLIDQNTQAFHMFMSAMLQLFDRSGMLYGELARFVLRILGVRSKSRKLQPGPGEVQGPNGQGQQLLEGPKASAGSWDTVWGSDSVNGAN